MIEQLQRQLLSLSVLLQLKRQARRAATAEELAFRMTNDPLELVRYRQALLWLRTGGRGGRLEAVSGLAAVDRNAPFVLWVSRLMRALESGEPRAIRAVSAADLPPELPDDVAREWADWMAPNALWVPLDGAGGRPLGALLFCRDQPWGEGERHLLSYLGESYGFTWGALTGSASPRMMRALFSRPRLAGAALAAALAAGLLLPVPNTVLAPADVVARDPVVVRAPIDGVVDRIAVQANEAVAVGQLLVGFDPAHLANRLEVARKEFAVVETQHRQASQQAVFDPRSKADLQILRGRMDQQAAEIRYLESMMERIEYRAPRPGVAIFDDANEWIGRPVKIGERIMLLADPETVELDVHVPVADAIVLKAGAEVRLFLNIDPQTPVAARLLRASYEAVPQPDGVLAYRVKAVFDPGQPVPRIGLKGTAKLYGEETTLFYTLMRRPLAVARQRLGL